MMQGPLHGIRVLDLTRVLAGPMATQTLADLGAEVIKIERPRTGDDTRSWGPPFVKDLQGQDTSDSTYFVCCNRGKKSITLDISTAQGQALVRRLAQCSDVLTENYKTGDLARYGLDYEALKAINPRLIYCSITGYGQSGPYSSRAGYDPIAQAMGGLMSVTGERDSEPGGGPQRVGVAVTDLLTGMYAVSGIMAALLSRTRTDAGQYLELALLDVQVASMINIAQAYLSAGIVAQRNGNTHPSVVPSQIFDCADGKLMLAAGNDGQFRKLCEVLGMAHLPQDSRFGTNDARVQNREAVIAILQKELAVMPVAYWTERLARAGVPSGPINDIAEVFRDPQVQHRGMRIEVEHPLAGPLPLVGNPLRLSETPVQYGMPPPLLGQHTDEVLRDLLNLTPEDVAALRRSGVV
jgi:crotonobetainyl-CoA:carnitine CoA-transferase CaiB-like acyl-CoA transferase